MPFVKINIFFVDWYAAATGTEMRDTGHEVKGKFANDSTRILQVNIKLKICKHQTVTFTKKIHLQARI